MVWCFGDSAGIDFGSGVASPIFSGMDSRGSCASIADQNGNLLFYAATMRPYAAVTTLSTFVYNSTNSVMDNGDSITGRAWYQELVIIPNPANDSTYYLFSIGVTSGYGLYYSIIDMRMNGGLGAVTLKNVQLQSFEQVDCINAIKHGNGRDWWLMFRKSDFSTSTSNNDWYTYLITPNNIQNFTLQTLGAQNRTNLGHVSFSPSGNKMAFVNLLGVVELFDFNRCSGLLSNHITIEENLVPPFPFTVSCEFSSDGNILYTTTNKDTSYLYQYDLLSTNISATKDTIWFTINPDGVNGALKRAPDNKIYLTSWYTNGFSSNYPYPDSMFNMYNMNLSVINQPDSLGGACDFQAYSFYLGGKRTYLGLPNNPDYDLPALAGSPCDSLTAIAEQPFNSPGTLYVYYAAGWDKAFINADKLKGKHYLLRMIDILGNEVYAESGLLNSKYLTRDLSCIGYAPGIYLLTFETEEERLVKKFQVVK